MSYRRTPARKTQRLPRGKNGIALRVMIELLWAEGHRFPGWYSPANLEAKYAEVMGACMSGGWGPQHAATVATTFTSPAADPWAGMDWAVPESDDPYWYE
jgi:hypothetical protein